MLPSTFLNFDKCSNQFIGKMDKKNTRIQKQVKIHMSDFDFTQFCKFEYKHLLNIRTGTKKYVKKIGGMVSSVKNFSWRSYYLNILGPQNKGKICIFGQIIFLVKLL